jgi:hypothetical protein
MRIALILLMLLITPFAMANTLNAAMTATNGNVSISFSDHEQATGFENYTCLVVFNRAWALEIAAVKQPNGRYLCQDSGSLAVGVYHEVVIRFEDRPAMNRTLSPMLLLKAN